MTVQNLERWQLPPSIELMLADSAFAERLLAECRSGDTGLDGSSADHILCELLRKLGMKATADVYENLPLWRA